MIQDDSVKIDRKRLIIKPNAIVGYKGNKYRIINILNTKDVVIANLESARSLQVSIRELSVLSEDDSKLNQGEDISAESWQIALDRYEIIRQLIDHSTVEAVKKTASEHNLHVNTIWKWLKAYRENKSILALIPKKRGWTTEKTRLSPELNNIIQQAIHTKYLTSLKPSIAKTILEVKLECFKRKIEPPHDNTIRYRIEALNGYEVTKARYGKKAAKDKYEASAGTFPNADYPLAYVQIDHTPLDIEIVDEQYRETIGKAYLTLAIDVFSRMIVGYYLSLEAPSATSVAMCISSAIISKKRKLLELDVDGEWDIEGIMDSVHSDNGSDFRTNHLHKACLKYDINWEYRPIGGAKYGGHIERLLGIVNLEMHVLDGTTKSNIFEKGTYDSAKNACLILRELEHYIVYWIVNVYHKSKHSILEVPPQQMWEEGIWGTKFKVGTGLKERVADEATLFLDFAPEFESTIQRTGVKKDKLFYFADCLRPWINAIDSTDDEKKRKRKFIFKRDPRDISMIWFYEPNTNTYFKVPTAKREIPSIGLHEYRQVQAYLNSERLDTVDQDAIYRAIIYLREKVDQAVTLTKKQRRMNQRRKENGKMVAELHHENKNNSVTHTNVDAPKSQNSLWDQNLTAFDDLR
ncbi:DDE-type integrase/transposase/recombinase [Acinetobacter apis]|uniref:Putative transposase n=1 Tax=Acinetobacter apis TaxID=1229165 RepID=A0A217EI22_9GAMM|nr:DDE-type integrase/transposase/recombinase [Acinetobacter apis]SNQ30004.1 putative transposase [Acinetobacter apis]